MEYYVDGFGAVREQGPAVIISSLCLSLLMGTVLAAVYRATHSGVSYSRSFVQTLVLASIVSAIMIIAIGNNMARGLGILGALAIIRFRTPIRDPRDIIFLFASLAIGISAGSGIFLVAVCGTAFFGVAALVLSRVPAFSRRKNEGLLRLVASKESKVDLALSKVFSIYSNNSELVAVRDALQGDSLEYAYQVSLVDPSLNSDFLDTVRKITGVSDVTLMMQRETVEI